MGRIFGLALDLMRLETITDERDLLIRRLLLAPGEATAWHIDRCRRFTVVVRGERLQIEFKEPVEPHTTSVHPGLAEWDEPTDLVHRAVNTGTNTYEEVVTFFRTRPNQEPQPAK